ncbi:MAG: hypothetical protein LBQ12_06970 [Deltaproteobacteria bacterium]|nr:hypothetical protein [Deltaproteobacteria bacterium]
MTEETAYCLPALDDIISNGAWLDWADLREAIKKDRSLLDGIERVCKNFLDAPYSQRYHFWYNYVQKHKKIS